MSTVSPIPLCAATVNHFGPGAQHQPKNETPDYIYIALPLVYAPMIFTAPTGRVEIPENPTAAPSKNPDFIVIKLKNNGRFKIKPVLKNEELLGFMTDFFSDTVLDILREFLMRVPGFINVASREELKEMVETLLAAQVRDTRSDSEKKRAEEWRHLALKRWNRLVDDEGQLEFQSADWSRVPEIDSMFFNGQEFAFRDRKKLQSMLEPILKEEILDTIKAISPVHEEDYLYTALSLVELEEVSKNGIMPVRIKTDFFKERTPLLEHELKNAGPGAVVARIRVIGPYFHTRTMYGRITAVVPHFAPVEILSGNKWIHAFDCGAVFKKARAEEDSHSQSTDP